MSGQMIVWLELWEASTIYFSNLLLPPLKPLMYPRTFKTPSFSLHIQMAAFLVKGAGGSPKGEYPSKCRMWGISRDLFHQQDNE